MKLPEPLSAEQRAELTEAKAWGEKLFRRLAAAEKKLKNLEGIRVKVHAVIAKLEAAIAADPEEFESINLLASRRQQLVLLNRSIDAAQWEIQKHGSDIQNAAEDLLPGLISKVATPLVPIVTQQIADDFALHFRQPHAAKDAATSTDTYSDFLLFLRRSWPVAKAGAAKALQSEIDLVGKILDGGDVWELPQRAGAVR